jgi:hypothetical protein
MAAKSETMNGVIDAIVENRRRFEAFCRSLSAEELLRPVPESTWIVRDFAAHLDTLDVELASQFGSAVEGNGVDTRRGVDGAPFDIDAFNDAQVAERRAWPLDQVFAEARQNRSRLIEVLKGLSDEQVSQPMHFAGDAKRTGGELPLKLFLAGWAQHDPIHVADMLRALPERAGDPEVAAWVANPFVMGYQAAMNKPAT